MLLFRLDCRPQCLGKMRPEQLAKRLCNGLAGKIVLYSLISDGNTESGDDVIGRFYNKAGTQGTGEACHQIVRYDLLLLFCNEHGDL